MCTLHCIYGHFYQNIQLYHAMSDTVVMNASSPRITNPDTGLIYNASLLKYNTFQNYINVVKIVDMIFIFSVYNYVPT